jgi:hypothetical protein
MMLKKIFLVGCLALNKQCVREIGKGNVVCDFINHGTEFEFNFKCSREAFNSFN